MSERNRGQRGNRFSDRARREWRGRGGLESYYEANRYYSNPDQWPRDDIEDDWEDEEATPNLPERDEENPQHWQNRRGEHFGPQQSRGPQPGSRFTRYRDQGREYRYRGVAGPEQRSQPGYSSFDDDADFGYHVDPRTRRSMRDQHWSEYEGYDETYGSAGMRTEDGLDYKHENEYGMDQGPVMPGQEFMGHTARGGRQQYGRRERYGRRRGPVDYTGAGPSSYHRSDTRIEEDICERLTMHSQIDARNIEVAVQDGEVTLRGSVPERMMKRLAEDSAADVFGVRDVQNNIRVNQPDRSRAMQRDFKDPQPEKRREFDGRREEEPSPAAATTLESGLSSEARHQHDQPLTPETRRQQLRQEMQVLSRDGKPIGSVKEIRERDFLVRRDMARDIYIPYSALLSVGESAIVQVDSGTVNDQGWENPQVL